MKEQQISGGISQLALAFAKFGALAINNSPLLEAINEPNSCPEDAMDPSLFAEEWASDVRTAAGLGHYPRDKGAALVVFTLPRLGPSGFAVGVVSYAVGFQVENMAAFNSAATQIEQAYFADAQREAIGCLQFRGLYFQAKDEKISFLDGLKTVRTAEPPAAPELDVEERERRIEQECAFDPKATDKDRHDALIPVDRMLERFVSRPGLYMR
jgi:hypothetical protein